MVGAEHDAIRANNILTAIQCRPMIGNGINIELFEVVTWQTF